MFSGSYRAITQVDPNLFKVYPADWVSTVVLELTGEQFPLVGRTALTYGTLLYWATGPFRVVPVILAVAGLLHTTSLSEIVSVLSALRVPFPIIFITTVALKFVPQTVDQIHIIRNAQKLRGWTVEGWNPIKRIGQLKPLFVPLIRNTIRSVDTVTMGAKNRAFGLGPVTVLVDLTFKTVDKILCAVVVTVTIFLVAASILWKLGSL
jgi:energy-coupling factor transporter transmembrane protein EcfT